MPSRWLVRLEALPARGVGSLGTGSCGGLGSTARSACNGRVCRAATPPRPSPPIAGAAAPPQRDRHRHLAARSLRDLRAPGAAAGAVGAAGAIGGFPRLRQHRASRAGRVPPARRNRTGRRMRRLGITMRLHQALRDAGVREALIAWWSPRLTRIAAWVDTEEQRRRRAAMPLDGAGHRAAGRVGAGAAGWCVRLSGAGRPDRAAAGRAASPSWTTRLGRCPRKTTRCMGREPQLLLEGAMVQAGAFGARAGWRRRGADLLAPDRGTTSRARRACLLDGGTDGLRIAVDDAADQLADLIDHYDDPATSYPGPAGTGAWAGSGPTRNWRARRNGAQPRMMATPAKARPPNEPRPDERGSVNEFGRAPDWRGCTVGGVGSGGCRHSCRPPRDRARPSC